MLKAAELKNKMCLDANVTLALLGVVRPDNITWRKSKLPRAFKEQTRSEFPNKPWSGIIAGEVQGLTKSFPSHIPIWTSEFRSKFHFEIHPASRHEEQLRSVSVH